MDTQDFGAFDKAAGLIFVQSLAGNLSLHSCNATCVFPPHKFTIGCCFSVSHGFNRYRSCALDMTTTARLLGGFWRKLL